MFARIVTINNLTKVVLLIAIVFALFSPATLSAQAIDQGSKDAACEGLAVSGGECDGSSGTTVGSLVTSVINIFSWVVGVAAVIMLIVGGFRYVVSAGDANGISSAKNTILYAIIGLVVAVLAQGIVQFVLRRVTS